MSERSSEISGDDRCRRCGARPLEHHATDHPWTPPLFADQARIRAYDVDLPARISAPESFFGGRVERGILSDGAIRRAVEEGEIEIDPFDPAQLNPASYDVRLGERVRVYDRLVGDDQASTPERGSAVGNDLYVRTTSRWIDVTQEADYETREYRIGPIGWLLKPGILYLMHTVERVGTDRYVVVLDGKSSLARLGMQIHLTAGYGDCGFRGQYTMEVTVVAPLLVRAGMRVGQVRFHTIAGAVEKLYEGNYAPDAVGPVPSRAWRWFK